MMSSLMLWRTFGILALSLSGVGVRAQDETLASVLDPYHIAAGEAAGVEELAALARAIEADAESRANAGRPYHSVLRRLAASLWTRCGDNSSALSACLSVVVDPETNFDEADAWRVMGQVESGRDLGAAEAAYTNEVRVLEEEGSFLYARHLVRARLALALVRQARGDYEGAIRARVVLLGGNEASLADKVRAKVLVENARDAFRMGDRAGGAAWFDRLFAELPAWGEADGSAVTLRIERALHAFVDDPRAMRAELTRLWQDPVLSRHPKSLLAGSKLSAMLDHDDDQRWVVRLEMLDRLRVNEAAGWGEPLRDPYTQRLVARTMEAAMADLMGLADLRGEATIGIEAAYELLSRYPESSLAGSVNAWLDRHE